MADGCCLAGSGSSRPSTRPRHPECRAGEVAAGADRHRTSSQASDQNRVEAVADCTVPDLAPVVRSPTDDLARFRQRTGMTSSGADRDDPARQPTDYNRHRTNGACPVSQLAVSVRAPALNLAAAGENARMTPARGHRHRASYHPLHRDRGAPVNPSSVSELPEVVPAPTLDLACVPERARVIPAGADRRRCRHASTWTGTELLRSVPSPS